MYFNPLGNPYLCICGTPYFAQSGGLVLSARQLFLQHAFIFCVILLRSFLIAFYVAVAKSGPQLPSGVGVPTFVKRRAPEFG